MPSFSYEDEMHEDVKPLSARERAWVTRLEKVLNACPTQRLGLITIGDPGLQVCDDTVASKHDFELHDGLARSNGVVLADISSRPNIHGVAG